MSEETVETLVLDLLEWIGPGVRPYAEVLEVWRTSCPRLAVWEEACRRGYVVTRHEPSSGLVVEVSAAGTAHLGTRRLSPSGAPAS